VATKYTQTARQHFAAKGVHVDLIKLYGSMELAPLTGLADAIVDLVSTGSTLKANQLVEVERIMDISARLVVNQAALKLKREPMRRADRRAGRAALWPKRACMSTSPHAPPARTAAPDFEAAFQRVLHWSAETDREIEQRWRRSWPTCAPAAMRRCWSTPARFDGWQADFDGALELGRDELQAAFDGLPPAQREALEAAAQRVRSYHERQKRRGAAGATATRRHPAGPEGHAAGPRGHLRARRQGGLSVQRC
jgi:hypothetical protein